MTASFRLSETHRAILAAATGRILPGAEVAGVTDYIENAMNSRWHLEFQPLFQQGLDFFQALGQELKEKDFPACDPQEQDDVLRHAQTFPNNDARRFFQKLVELTLEGYLCDPCHGGNRDGLGWSSVGYAPREPGVCREERTP